MWRAWFIPFFLVPGSTQIDHTRSALSCVSDYMTNISCEWKVSTWPNGQTCHLWGLRDTNKGKMEQTCVFNASRFCWIDFNTKNYFSFLEKIDLGVICNNSEVGKRLDFRPGHHVKLRPPEQLRISDGNLTWSRGARFPKRIDKYEYQLQVKSIKQRWEDVHARPYGGTFMSLDGDFHCKIECEARVRVKPTDPNPPNVPNEIHSQWSDWSSSVTWKMKVNSQPVSPIENKIVLLGIGGIFVFLLSIAIAVYSYSRILKTRNVPDPAKYFRPLIIEHKGNFQQWIGQRHSEMVFLPPNSCDCEISPVDEISDIWDIPLASDTANTFDPETNGYNHDLSSGISNMGYFYSEHKSGSISLDSCPVYFSYHNPEVGPARSTSSDEHPPESMSTSPDSGFGTSVEKADHEEEELDEHEAKEEPNEECSGVSVPHLVSFVMSFPERSRLVVSPSFSKMSPWPEEVESSEIEDNADPPEVAVVRPSSMVVQPCSDGYLTLKEMQKYSNKSI